MGEAQATRLHPEMRDISPGQPYKTPAPDFSIQLGVWSRSQKQRQKHGDRPWDRQLLIEFPPLALITLLGEAG